MQKSRNVRERTFQFVVDIIAFCRVVVKNDPMLRQITWQLVDAAGSTGANLEEAAEGQSKADFVARNYTALKEARDSRFWLRVIAASDPSSAARARELSTEASELIAMLIAIVKRAKSNPSRGRT